MGTLIFCADANDANQVSANTRGNNLRLVDQTPQQFIDEIVYCLGLGQIVVVASNACITTGWRAPPGTTLLMSSAFVQLGLRRNDGWLVQAAARADRPYRGGEGGYLPTRRTRPTFREGDRVRFNPEQLRGSGFENKIDPSDEFVIARICYHVGDVQQVELDRLAHKGQMDKIWINEWLVPAEPRRG